MNTDPIADMLTRIRNAVARSFKTVRIPASSLKADIAQTLVNSGYLKKYELVQPEEGHAYLMIELRYYANKSVINGLKRISKPGQRIYMNKTQLRKSLSSRVENIIVSTSHGIMTGQQAKQANLGGEVLFKIW